MSFFHFWRRKDPLGGAWKRHFLFNLVLLLGLCKNGHAALDLAVRLLTLNIVLCSPRSSEEKTSELSIWVETILSYLDIYIWKGHALLGSCNSLYEQQSHNFSQLKKMQFY